MAAASVVIKTVDLTTRVPAFPGVYGAIVIPNAKCGPVGVPTLVTSETQLLRRYTPNGRVGLGYDNAYYSAMTFLSRSNKLWVIRVANAASYGAAVFKAFASVADNAPSAVSNLDNPETYTFGADDAFLIYGADPGVWNNGLRVAIVDNNAKEPKSFYVVVYQDGVEVERILCSRVEGHLDGYGRNLYIEDALLASNYVRAFDNVAKAASTALKFTVANTPIALAGGDDGTAVTDSDCVAALQQVKSRDNMMVTLLLDGGRATPAFQSELIAVAEQRKDCVALLSTPYAAEASASYVNDLLTYRNTTLNANTSYAALYSPHVKVQDKFNNRQIYVSPEAYAGAIISETASVAELWYPPAGFRRGMVNALDVRRRFSDGERDVLSDAGINTLRFAPGRGIAIWGQKTLSSRPSALDRLNVRLLLIVIQPAIAEALEDFLFEFNDDSTRAQIFAVIDSYMSGIKGRRGVYSYTLICDETNNTEEDIAANRLNVDLFVQPSASAETINFNTIVSRDASPITALAA